MIVYGPVPSRRLGRSVGINNIPPKVCTYSCIYCQLGRTRDLALERRPFYSPERIFDDAQKIIERTNANGERIDYLTFVPDGEPTLDINLGREIELLRTLHVPVALITNSSLIWRDDVRDNLFDLDVVSLKVDAVSTGLWKRINRPHKQLNLRKILDGITQFSQQYRGTLITETMLIEGFDYSKEIDLIAEFLQDLNIKKAYIAAPTRPPAEEWVKPVAEEFLNQAFHTFEDRLGTDTVELLIGYEGDAFSSSGDLKKDLLSITSVHPMRKQAVEKLVERANASWDLISSLIEQEDLIELNYDGEIYYMRKIASR